MRDVLLDQCVAAYPRKFSQRSLAVYDSMWRRLSRGLGDKPSAPTAEELRDVLSGFPAYATRRKALGLYKWVATNHPSGPELLGTAFEEVEKEYVERPVRVYHLNTQEQILRAMLHNAGAVNGWKGVRLQALIWVLWETGMRQEELLSMSWAQVRWDAGCIRVAGRPSRELPVGQEALLALKAWRQSTPLPADAMVWVASEKGGLLAPSTLWRQLKRMEPPGVALELSLCGPTAFRAAFVRRCHEQGLAQEDIQKRLGHALASSTSELLKQVLGSSA